MIDLFVVALALLLTAGCAGRDLRPLPPELGLYVGRDDYLHLLEPHGDRILHGAGANPADFTDYWDELSRTPPLLYATHFDLMGLQPGWSMRVVDVLARFPDFIIPQIAVSLTREGRPYEVNVAEGELDDRLDILCQGLAAIQRPVFLRIGYGFGAPATGYRPAPYRQAWIRVVETVRLRYGLRNVAMVWCYAADGGADFMPFYPGDEYVDWWALDVFDPRTTRSRGTRAFLVAAREHAYPVMIGEMTPRGLRIEPDSHVWNHWFVPMFRFIRANPGIKAFCYINWDAGGTRLSEDLDLLQNYRQTLDDDVFLDAAPLEQVRWQLQWGQ